MSVDDIQRGMKGVGRTVFQGTRIDTFGVEVLGVLRNVFGPKSDMILARLSGGPMAQTGVIAGMSGSPVYIEGKLVGAVGYSIGAFAEEPIAGDYADWRDDDGAPTRIAGYRVERDLWIRAVEWTNRWRTWRCAKTRGCTLDALGICSASGRGISRRIVKIRPVAHAGWGVEQTHPCLSVHLNRAHLWACNWSGAISVLRVSVR